MRVVVSRRVWWVLLVLLVPAANAHAEGQTEIGLNAGFARLTGPGNDLFDNGFSVAAQAFHHTAPLFAFGGHIGFARWNASNDGFTRLLTVPGAAPPTTTTSGSVQSWEITPAMRLTSDDSISDRMRGFIQFGAGLYIVKEDVTFEAVYAPADSIPPQNGSRNETLTELGVHVGAGFSFAVGERTWIDIFPLYHWVFARDVTLEYFYLSAGVSFGFGGKKMGNTRPVRTLGWQ